MKKFNKDKYLRKLKFKRFYRKYERYFYIGIPCLLIAILGIYFAFSKFTTTADTEVVRTTVSDFIYGDVVIKIYVNGEYSETAPQKNTGYKVDSIVCDNGAVGEWNNDDWGPTITNVTKRNKCSIYFGDANKIKFGNTTIKLDEYGRCPSMNDDGTVTVTGAEDTYGYLCKAKDAYGDSYYFRGNVTNNYVKFGKWSDDTPTVVHGYYSETDSSYREYNSMETCQNASSYNTNCTVVKEKNAPMYWRIIRMNGDGSVRVIYDGTSAHANGEASSDRQIGTSAFNDGEIIDNAYIGYMYGDSKGLKGSTSYELAHANINDSRIKDHLDSWYGKNIKGTSNEKYIVDNIFCNDRSLAPNNSGTGAGRSQTYYRWYNFANSSNNNKMMLTCPQKNDAFTVNDTSKGNGALTYGIGLITADEVVLGGGWSSDNSNYYLYTGREYWTSSPYDYSRRPGAVERLVYSNGIADYNYAVSSTLGARPVISLTSEILEQGDGTASNPFHPAS